MTPTSARLLRSNTLALGGGAAGGFGSGDGFAKGRAERRPVDALLGDDRRDVAVGRDVEGRVGGANARRGDPPAADVCHLVRGALLDRDLVAGGQRQVDRGGRCRDIKRKAVLLAEN